MLVWWQDRSSSWQRIWIWRADLLLALHALQLGRAPLVRFGAPVLEPAPHLGFRHPELARQILPDVGSWRVGVLKHREQHRELLRCDALAAWLLKHLVVVSGTLFVRLGI